MRLLEGIVRPTLLVGSFPYKTALETLTVSGPALAGIAKRLTDGEPQGWTRFAGRVLAQVPALELDESWLLIPDRPLQQYRLKPRTLTERPDICAGWLRIAGRGVLSDFC